MAYEEDPVVVAFSRRFEETSSGYAFRLAGTDFTLSVSDDEYLSGLYRAQSFASFAKFCTIAISVAALSSMLIPVMQGRWSWWALLLFASGAITSITGSSLALWLAWRPFRKRLLREVREKRGWKRRGLFAGARASGIPPIIAAIAAGMVLLTAWVLKDHNRRVNLLAAGQHAVANVTFSGFLSGRSSHCQVDFALSYAGDTYKGSTTQCHIMESYKVGKALPVRFDPASPAGVIAEGDTTWDALVAVPILMWPILLLIIIFGYLPFAFGFEPRRPIKINDDLF